MDQITKIADEIVAREGGYVNDPDDPGGPTNRGVTLRTLQRLGQDLDGDGAVTSGDLKRLSHEQAREIFITHYFHRPKIDALPECLQASVFDMYVNAGASAVRILQQLLTRMRLPCVADGVIGPQTVAAARQAARIAPDHLADAYGIARRSFYYELADRRPGSRKYARRRDGGKGGWILRAEEFISPRFHLSPSDHATRVSGWD